LSERHFALLVSFLLLSAGCAKSTELDGGFDTSVTDSGGRDSAPTDTGVRDSGRRDSAMDSAADTDVGDTGGGDSTVDAAPDTGPGDTGPDDTGTPMGTPYVTGATYGGFVLVSITDRGAPAGTYTILGAGDRGPTVDALRDGTVVSTIPYAWTTTIGSVGSGLEYTFSFPGLFDVVIAKAGPGTRNLYQVNVDVFDGTRFWTP